MRVIVFSDVHGNLTALDAVLDDIERQPDVDVIVFAGDACLFGPRPEQCATRIREFADLCLVGNTDEWVAQPPPIPAGAPNKARLEYIAQVAGWTRERLSAESTNWLDQLPFAHTIAPTNKEASELLIVHANPHDTMQVIYPPEEMQREHFGKVRQSDQELDELLAGVTAGAVAYGHLHIPNVRTWGQTLLANTSSVSLPGDGDPRAKYGVLDWDGLSWHVRHAYVAYDIGSEIEAFRRLQPPDWEQSVSVLEELRAKL